MSAYTASMHCRQYQIRRRSSFQAPALVLLVLLACGDLQDVGPATKLCETCEIVLDSIGPLRDSPDFPVGSLRAAALGDEELYVAYSEVPTEVVVYGLDGVPRRKIGSEGEGPGEYLDIRALATDGPDLFIYDTGNNRVTHVRSDSVAGTFTPPPTARITNRGAEANGSGGHLLVRRGAPDPLLIQLSSTGDSLGVTMESGWSEAQLFSFSAVEGVVWALNSFTGQLSSSEQAVVRERPSWFTPTYAEATEGLESHEGARPGPYAIAVDLQATASGHVWVASQRPDLASETVETVLEAIHAESAATLTSTVLDYSARFFLSDELVVLQGPDIGLVPNYLLYTVTLLTDSTAPSP